MPNHPPRIPGPSGPPFEGSIFWNPSEAVDIVEMPLGIITTGTQDMGNGVYWLRAGTPLDEYFAVSNDEDAVYLVAEDFYFISTKPDQAKIVPLITAGYVDLGKAEKAAGIHYTDACLSALETAGIVMVDGTIAGGGGGGGVLVVHADENRVLDKTWQEIKDASATKPVVILPEPGDQFSPQLWALNVFNGDEMYGVLSWGTFNFNEPNMLIFVVSSADGYPVYTPT